MSEQSLHQALWTALRDAAATNLATLAQGYPDDSAMALALLTAQYATLDARVTALETSPMPSPPPSTPMPVGLPGPFTLLWQDEFAGMALDLAKWTPHYRWTGIINNESAAYDPSHVSVHDGYLDLVMTKTPAGTQPYTSGCVASYGKFHFTYGVIEARLKIPTGQGQWPAFWMLVDGAEDRELDILEVNGRYPYEAVMTASWNHGAGYSGWHAWDGPDFSLDYHTFAVDWTPTYVAWLIDGVERLRFTSAQITIASAPMYVLLNLAMFPQNGTGWGGGAGVPDATKLPTHLLVDYVRVWQRA